MGKYESALEIINQSIVLQNKLQSDKLELSHYIMIQLIQKSQNKYIDKEEIKRFITKINKKYPKDVEYYENQYKLYILLEDSSYLARANEKIIDFSSHFPNYDYKRRYIPRI